MIVTDNERELAGIWAASEIKWLRRERYKPGLSNILNECKTTDHLWLIKELLNKFTIASSSELEDCTEKMADFIQNKWALSPTDSYICALADSDRPDGSQSIIRSLETNLSRSWKNSIFNNIEPALNLEKKTIVIVDDFLGSGKKASDKIDEIIQYGDTNNFVFEIYVCALAGMEESYRFLKNKIGNDHVFYGIVLEKGITSLANKEDRLKAINSMIELEQPILPIAPYPRNKKFQEYNFGYKYSEALFFQEGANIPNNVFPIFWKDNYAKKKGEPKLSRTPLFHRR